MEIIISIIGTTVTVISFAYALYTQRERKKLQEEMRSNAWASFKTINNVLGFFADHERKSPQIEFTPELRNARIRTDEYLVRTMHNLLKQYEGSHKDLIEKWYQDKRINEPQKNALIAAQYD